MTETAVAEHASSKGGGMTSYERDIGRLEAVVANLERQNTELKHEIAALHSDLKEIKTMMSELKGGSRVVFWLGGLISGGIGAILIKLFPIFIR